MAPVVVEIQVQRIAPAHGIGRLHPFIAVDHISDVAGRPTQAPVFARPGQIGARLVLGIADFADIVDLAASPVPAVGSLTDAELNEIGEPVMLHCQPAGDSLPDPESCLLTGILPQQALRDGLPEHEFAARIESELARDGTVTLDGLGLDDATLARVERIHVVACGTSFHAGLVGRYLIEDWAHIPVHVEVASEYRYRTCLAGPGDLVIGITQSGETADTLAALRHAQSLGMTQTLTICNVATSAMVRECEFAYITRAGAEIGVASTKAFTTQLAALFLLAATLAKQAGRLDAAAEVAQLAALRHLPVDHWGIPTGASEECPAKSESLGDRVFDDGFDEVPQGAVFALAGGDRRIEVVFNRGFPAVQIFAPGNDDVVGIEPMTAPTNALRKGGYSTAVPGRPASASFTIRVR